jgi:hypothetical protein
MSETTNTPNQPESNQPEGTPPELHSAEPTGPAPAPSTPASGKRKFLVAGGSILAAVLLAGGGIAVGAAIADEGDDEGDGVSATVVSEQDDENTDDRGNDDRDSADDDDTREDDAGDGDGDRDDDDSTRGADHGATSAEELIEALDAAASEADGTAVSLDAGPDGSWDVEFRAESGDETEVRVASDGTATVVSTESPDSADAAPTGGLDAETVEALVSAAFAEVDGRIVDLEVDDDTTSPYDISVLTGDGRMVDLALDGDLKVLATDTDG